MSWKKLWYKITHIFESRDKPIPWRYRKCSSCGDTTCAYAHIKYKDKQACGNYKLKNK